jgi:hypothetical protein
MVLGCRCHSTDVLQFRLETLRSARVSIGRRLPFGIVLSKGPTPSRCQLKSAG